MPAPTAIRDDLDVPVMVFQTETDVVFSNLGARQPDTDRYRLWEVAGTAHFDFYGLDIGMTDTGDGQGAVEMLASMQNPTNQPNPLFTCQVPINTGPAHFVLDTAFQAMDRWLAHGVRPPIAPRLETTGSSPVVFATDANGNVRRRHPHPGRRRPGRHPERPTPGRQPVLRPVRHDGPAHRGPAGGPVPDPRPLRLRLGRRRAAVKVRRLPHHRRHGRADPGRRPLGHRPLAGRRPLLSAEVVAMATTSGYKTRGGRT